MTSSTELDAADTLAAHRTLFVRDDSVVSYLDGNSLGRPLKSSAERISRFVTEQWAGRLIRGWDESWLELPHTIGDELGAAALGAAAGQVVVADSTTVVLYKLVRAAVAARPDRREIVVSRDDFPTDRYVVEGIAAERDLTVRWIDPAGEFGGELGVTPEALRAVVSDATAVVVLSHVGYRSGYLADMTELTTIAHDAGALVVWDVSHSVGSVEVELDASGADLATGCSYKYLCGGPGSPAFAYVRSDLQSQLSQPIQGWLGASAPFEMGPAYASADGIRGFTSGTPPILGMLAMRDMIELIAEVGIGAIRAKSVALTEFAIELADELLPHATLATPRDASRRGSHITLDGGGFADIVPKLWAQGVIPDFRAPDGVRIGLSPLSTSFAEVELGMFAIRHPGS